MTDARTAPRVTAEAVGVLVTLLTVLSTGVGVAIGGLPNNGPSRLAATVAGAGSAPSTSPAASAAPAPTTAPSTAPTTAATSPVSPPSTAPVPAAPPTPAHVVHTSSASGPTLPASLLGRPKAHGPEVDATIAAANSASAAAAAFGLKGGYALYGTPVPGTTRYTHVLEVAAFHMNASTYSDAVLSGFFDGVARGARGSVSSLTDEPPGPRGGSAQCGYVTLKSVSVRFSVCAWATAHTVGAVFDLEPGSNAAPLVTAIRAATRT